MQTVRYWEKYAALGGSACPTRRGLTGWYTGREHGCQYGLNGDEPKRTCRPPGSPRMPPVFHAREAVDQRDSPATLPRAGADFSGTGTGRLVLGAVPVLWL